MEDPQKDLYDAIISDQKEWISELEDKYNVACNVLRDLFLLLEHDEFVEGYVISDRDLENHLYLKEALEKVKGNLKKE